MREDSDPTAAVTDGVFSFGAPVASLGSGNLQLVTAAEAEKQVGGAASGCSVQ